MNLAVTRGSLRSLHWKTCAHRNWRPVMAAQSSNVFSAPGADDLRSKKAVKVPPEQLPTYLKSVPSWKANSEGTILSKKFVAKNFMAAIKFFNAVAEVAESEGHHPDLHLTNYREVEVVMTTHVKGGLTTNDFIMAAKLDAVPVDYSPKWLKQQEAAMATEQQQTSES